MDKRTGIVIVTACLCMGLQVAGSQAHAQTSPTSDTGIAPFSASLSDVETTAPLPALSDVLSQSASNAEDLPALSSQESPSQALTSSLSDASVLDPVLPPQDAVPAERPLGEVFINNSKLANQAVEFYGQGSRPVSNGMKDSHSVYQDKDAIDPTEFGGGIKFNATDNFSISVEAGGELESDDSVDVDSGAVKFQLSY
ncbi:hypothetical protein L4C36_17740 [Photobacterium japonica]|uniref:hypothetical protein n=1 Tax=Photobacterium japonica TaxID=2910235 RepID=UPI003D0A5EF4